MISPQPPGGLRVCVHGRQVVSIFHLVMVLASVKKKKLRKFEEGNVIGRLVQCRRDWRYGEGAWRTLSGRGRRENWTRKKLRSSRVKSLHARGPQISERRFLGQGAPCLQHGGGDAGKDEGTQSRWPRAAC